jgi:hypothetical protein
MAMELAKANADNQELSRFFLAWHAFEGAKLVLRKGQVGQLRDALALFVQLNVHNPLWPLRLFEALRIWRVVRRLDTPA